jgi:hypothetical protein
MFALDLFNTDYERRLMEGGVDTLEQRRIDDLAAKMDELAARAQEPAYRANPAALAGLKKQFAKLKDERDSYYRVREAGIPGNVPTEKIPGKEDLLKGKGRSYYEDQKKNLNLSKGVIPTEPLPEHGGGIGPKQRWQDLMPEQMNPEDYEDEDEDEDLRLRSGDYVRDAQDGESGEIFRMQGDPYERRVRILDRDGRGWYIEPSRLTRVDPTDPNVQRYFGKKRVRDMDEAVDEKGALKSAQAAAKFIIRNLDDRAALKDYSMHFWSPEKFYQGATMAIRGADFDEIVRQITQDRPAQFESGVAEGWSDAMVARRTGSPRTPYAVYIKGKKWKDFENEELAQAVANKLRAKFKTDGRDPETITIAPADMSEGLKSTLAGAALAGAMALGGAGAAQAQSAAGGSSMPNATTIIQQIQAGKIQNQNDLSAALGDNQSIQRFVFKQLQAKAGLPGHGADSVINALAKKSTSGAQQPGAQQPVKSVGQSGSIVQRPTDNFESRIKEEQDSSGVERAILNRIMVAHTDLLMKFGPDKVMQAAEEVAYNVGDVDEIGTSDVSAYVAQVKQILGAVSESKLEEKWTAKYKSSINCANPKGFSQKAHCAGKKK